MSKLKNLFKKSNKETKSENQATPYAELDEQDYWVCHSCGAHTSRSLLCCKDCGKYR